VKFFETDRNFTANEVLRPLGIVRVTLLTFCSGGRRGNDMNRGGKYLEDKDRERVFEKS